VNELKASNLISLEEGEEDEILLLYPHQLTVVDNGMLMAVKQSYYKGSHYLIKAVLTEK
jgi:hypothetical protein